MPHSPAVRLGPVAHLPSTTTPPPTPCPENHSEDNLGSGGRTVDRLGQGEAVGVVAHHHGPPQNPLEVDIEWPPIQHRRVRVLHLTVEGGDGPRRADSHRLGHVQAHADFLHQVGHGGQYALVVTLWGGDFSSVPAAPRRGQASAPSRVVPPRSNPYPGRSCAEPHRPGELPHHHPVAFGDRDWITRRGTTPPP